MLISDLDRLQDAFDHAQLGLRSARAQETEMRKRIKELETRIQFLEEERASWKARALFCEKLPDQHVEAPQFEHEALDWAERWLSNEGTKATELNGVARFCLAREERIKELEAEARGHGKVGR